MGDRTLKNKVIRLKEKEQDLKELETQINALKSEIKAEMESRDAEKLTVGDYIIRYSKMVSNCFNSKQFKEDHPKLYKKYIATQETRRFSIV